MVADEGCREPHCTNGLIRRIKPSEAVAASRVRVNNQYDVADGFKERVDEMVRRENVILEYNCEHSSDQVKCSLVKHQRSKLSGVGYRGLMKWPISMQDQLQQVANNEYQNDPFIVLQSRLLNAQFIASHYSIISFS